MSKIKIITFLGKTSKNQETDKYDESIYTYGGNLKNLYTLEKNEYVNMFSFLIDNFGHKSVSAIFTKDSRDSQKAVFEIDNFPPYNFDEKNLIKDKNDFSKIIKTINQKLDDERNLIKDENDFYEIIRIINQNLDDDYDFIIDLTHGFRHIPILATISMIAQSLSNTDKIKHIFFAKEITPKKEYEIIDLKEFLDIANMTYMLQNFDKNYTIALNSNFDDSAFQDLKDELVKLSNQILSNSLKNLNKLLQDILQNIKKIETNNDKIFTFAKLLGDVKNHVEELQKIFKKSKKSEQLYEMARLFHDRGYLLNAITLLFESVGYYCVESFKNFDPLIKEHIEKFENIINGEKLSLDELKVIDKKKFSEYELCHQSRNFVKNDEFSGNYLYNPETLTWSKSKISNTKPNPRRKICAIHENIRSKLDSISELENFREFINKIENLRNNLAHGNSSYEIDNPKKELSGLLGEYKKFCIEKDILN